MQCRFEKGEQVYVTRGIYEGLGGVITKIVPYRSKSKHKIRGRMKFRVWVSTPTGRMLKVEEATLAR